MPIEKTDKIWMDGEARRLGRREDPRPDATRSTTARASSRASARTRRPTGPAVFRLTDHIDRLFDSAHLFLDGHPVLARGDRRGVQGDGAGQRPRRRATSGRSRSSGYGEIGLNPLPCPVNVSIAVWPWGSYLGEESLNAGVRMMVSSWRAHRPERQPRRGQGHRHLHQLEPGQDRGDQVGLRRGDPAQHAGLRVRVHGREHLHRQGRRAGHARRSRRARSRASRVTPS